MTTPRSDLEATARTGDDSAELPAREGWQFAPGTLVARRYRIISLLGSGGMGEVYRADDTKLGQAVALKVLPAAMAHDSTLLSGLHDEVRLGRQVSHPNVCRIYDIGEFEGGHFIAMEYVDGEDLARLLRRIGRLPHDKATDLSHAIAAGLAAAHAKGILHRDLKPANVMIDGHGQARITDFGLALSTAREQHDVAGTPAYMAPEQLEGRPASVQSDIYSLGMVMYEMYTGNRPYGGHSVAELRSAIASETRPPSSVLRDIDPQVEAVILRCLSRDPEQRPRSAREVMTRLPGGDPLAAALAAGDTPSPGVVAAAGIEGSLRPALAWSWLGLIALLLTAVVFFSTEWRVMRYIPLDKPPAVLEQNAVDAGRAVGIEPGANRVCGFSPKPKYLVWIEEHDHSRQRFDHLGRGPAAVGFWMKESRSPLTPLGDLRAASIEDPPLKTGMATIHVDTTGRLLALEAAAAPGAKPGAHADWSKLLALAGFEEHALHRVPPKTIPPAFADERMAWDGVWPDDPTKQAHIEAAAYGGVPVFFSVSGEWDADVNAPFRVVFATRGLAAFLRIFIAVLVIITAIFALRNLRLRRGDRTGGLRLALAVFCIESVAFLLPADHRAVLDHETVLFVRALQVALFWGTVYFLLYIALEPYVRRRWPERLISWTRLSSGRIRDPLVGRDILIGIAAGAAHATLANATNWLPGVLGQAPPRSPHVTGLDALLGLRHVLGSIVSKVSSGMIAGLMLTVLLVALNIVFRRRLAAAIALFVIQIIGFAVAVRGDHYAMAASILIVTIWTLVIVRVGLLGIVVAELTFGTLFQLPISFDLTSWMAPSVMTPVLTIALLAAFAFYTALGGQPIWSARLLDE